MKKIKLDINALNQLFIEAHTYVKWQKKEVNNLVLEELYNLTKMGPTSSNCQPLRIYFVKSLKEREKLLKCIAEGNIEKTKEAPVTAILAWDSKFYDYLPTLSPHNNAKSWFEGKEQYIHETAFRNSSIQGGYFILAARALGLDAGPMSGFNADLINKEFFGSTGYKVNFICNLGYGANDGYHKRNPRPEFKDFCKII